MAAASSSACMSLLSDRVGELSLGTSGLGGVYYDDSGKLDQAEINKAVAAALDAGMTLLDTAPWYMQAEQVLGHALKASGIDRQRYIIQSKCGRYRDNNKPDGVFDYSRERIRTSLQQSLQHLQTDYIDIVLLHDVEFMPLDVVLKQGLPALRQLRDRGLIRHIGICGYPLDVLDEIVQHCDDIDVVQSYCHGTLQNDALLSYAKRWAKKGIFVLNAAPLAMGLLTESGARDWHPAPKQLRDACADGVADMQANNGNSVELALSYALDLARSRAAGSIASTVFGCVNSNQVLKAAAVAAAKPAASVVDLCRAFQSHLKEWKNWSWESGRSPAHRHQQEDQDSKSPNFSPKK